MNTSISSKPGKLSPAIADGNIPPVNALPQSQRSFRPAPMRFGIHSLELLLRYQTSLDRLLRNILLNLEQ